MTKRFLVFEPPVKTEAGRVEATGPSDRTVFLRDGFSIWAFLFPALWLLRYRLIASAILALVVSVGAPILGGVHGLPLAGLLVPLLAGLLVALEGPRLRAARLRRKGYAERAVLYAPDLDEAAILYYAGDPKLVARTASRSAALPWRFVPGAPKTQET